MVGEPNTDHLTDHVKKKDYPVSKFSLKWNEIKYGVITALYQFLHLKARYSLIDMILLSSDDPSVPFKMGY